VRKTVPSGVEFLGRNFRTIRMQVKESGREMRRKRSRRKVDTAWRKKRKKADYGSKSFN
jgi:hypothetical protein